MSASSPNSRSTSSEMKSPAQAPGLAPVPLYERVVLASAVVLGSYAGVLARISFQFERGLASAPSNYTVMYAQLLGSFLLGVLSQFQVQLAGTKAPLLHRAVYTCLTVGFCGSVTSFSTWMYEANKQLFTQFDYSWGSIASTYDGGRFGEWCVGLWLGVVLPLSALHGGMHTVQFVKWLWPSAPPPGTPLTLDEVVLMTQPVSTPRWYSYAVFGFPVLCVVATLCAVLIPMAIRWTVLMSALLFGAAGAYIRYLLSFVNNRPPLRWCRKRGFPIGTFIVNVVGSLILAATTLVSKFYVSYHDHFLLVILYGISTGFCGAMTTMSTFVLEIHRLPRAAAYVYVLTTVILSQLGWVFIFNIGAASIVSTAANEGGLNGPIGMCPTYQQFCTHLLDGVACPLSKRVLLPPCSVNPFPNPFCSCALFDGSGRLGELVIDTQTKGNVSQSLVPIWPSFPDGGPVNDVSSAVDMCLSHQALCDHMLNRIRCPHSLRQLNSCSRGGLREWVGKCTCGDYSWGDTRVFELIVDTLAYRRYDMLPYGSYSAAPSPVDLCEAYVTACEQHLNHVACPPAGRVIEGCSTDVPFDYENFVGTCQCFPRYENGTSVGYDAGTRIAEDILDALVKPRWWPLMNVTRPASANGSQPALFDVCTSFQHLCDRMMERIGCPLHLQTGVSCAAGTAWPDNYVGTCECGAMLDLTTTRCLEYVIDGILSYEVYELTFIPPAMSPYLLAAAYNPFKPLLAPEYPLPGANGL